jgi:hypothetical protein
MSYISNKPPRPERPRLPAIYYDTADSGWFEAVADAVGLDPVIEIYDWLPGGGRWITVRSSSLPERGPFRPALRRLLRREGVTSGRFRRR